MNEEFKIKQLGKQDAANFYKLIRLFQDVFETKTEIKVGEIYLKKLLARPDFIVFAIFSEKEIVGGLTAYELRSYFFEGSEIYIYDIAIKREFQRKGLGKKLILSLKKYCQQNSVKVMFVEAHEADEHAVNFYHSTGAESEKVIHFNYVFGEENGHA
ncbi:MAG: GNAT family N-acetyltransferase [Ginsengibacter sp.]